MAGIKLKIHEGNFDVVNSKKSYGDVFANLIYGDEITVICSEGKVAEEDIIEIEKEWKLISFDTKLDFDVVGFIAKISQALAKENISIFVVSSYSTDHILIKNKDFDKTIEVLKNLGMEA
jgi:uncharacterized protein